MTADALFHTKQFIYIVRHGVAEHNVKQLNNGIYANPNLLDPKYTDARLLPRGHLQAREVGKVIQSIILQKHRQPPHCHAINAIISSPLTRCLQTASEIAQKIKFQDRWIVREELREAHGVHFSDKRSRRSELEHSWSHADFRCITEQDQDWKSDQRETVQDVNKRIDSFLEWLSWNELVQSNAQTSILNTVDDCTRTTSTTSASPTANQSEDPSASPNTCLVISHGIWMELFLKKYFPKIMEGGKRVYNCNVFKATLECQWENRGSAWNCRQIKISHVDLIRCE
jgi:broad specificity phosphatase PhoE